MTREEQRDREIRERQILGIKPWQFLPSRVSPRSRNPFRPGSDQHREWERARALRIQIDERRKLRAGAATKPEGEAS